MEPAGAEVVLVIEALMLAKFERRDRLGDRPCVDGQRAVSGHSAELAADGEPLEMEFFLGWGTLDDDVQLGNGRLHGHANTSPDRWTDAPKAGSQLMATGG